MEGQKQLESAGLRALRRLKNAVVPAGPRLRRLPLGIGRGLRLQVDLRHHSGLYLGLYEIELNRHLRAQCRPGFKCFDVGGQLGYDALVLAKLTGGAVVSFECEPTAVASMQTSFEANPQLKSLPVAECAFVASVSDPARRHIALDDYVHSPNGFIPDFIKIDVEGHELEVLKGADRILRERSPNLIVETHSAELERLCLAYLHSLGYSSAVVDQRRWIPDLRPTEHNRWIRAEAAESR
jgi:hypothetical protein